ncbi:cell division control protein 45, partial [Clonorchis sinensis]
LPRRECLQRYSTMTSTVRESLNSLFLQYGEKYGLSRRDLFLPSFTVQLGYRTPVSAIDAVFLTLSALECHGDGDPSVNFQRALDTLSCWSLPSLDNEITRAQAHLQSLASQVRNLIDTDEIVAFGPFLYAYLRKTSLVSIALRNTLSLSILSKYVLMAKAALRPKLGRERRVVQMPLIFCIDSRADEENITLIGIPPLHGDDDRNLFGQAFEAAVRRTKARAEFRYFDTNCEYSIELNSYFAISGLSETVSHVCSIGIHDVWERRNNVTYPTDEGYVAVVRSLDRIENVSYAERKFHQSDTFQSRTTFAAAVICVTKYFPEFGRPIIRCTFPIQRKPVRNRLKNPEYSCELQKRGVTQSPSLYRFECHLSFKIFMYLQLGPVSKEKEFQYICKMSSGNLETSYSAVLLQYKRMLLKQKPSKYGKSSRGLLYTEENSDDHRELSYQTLAHLSLWFYFDQRLDGGNCQCSVRTESPIIGQFRPYRDNNGLRCGETNVQNIL